MKSLQECAMGLAIGACLALILVGAEKERPELVGLGVLLCAAVAVFVCLWL